VFIIGIDPHKGSHTAAVLDDQEQLVAELRVVAHRRQRDQLLDFAAGFEPRTWAIEAAGGLGASLASVGGRSRSAVSPARKLLAETSRADSHRSQHADIGRRLQALFPATICRSF
jgi:hypothetical protein